MTLLVISTHPIQYQAPVYRTVQQQFGVPTTVIYASDFSISGYRDGEFGASFAWDTDLLSGYTSHFLSRVATSGPQSYATVTAAGLAPLLKQLDFRAAFSSATSRASSRRVLGGAAHGRAAAAARRSRRPQFRAILWETSGS
ncbi:MAG: hypothetical protein IPK17_22305 [Chloroflexi bacterium]|uniref:hypothetical protein n=1 Tax=Candidatus Flexifilum breve TaxID=3140694 RepID=UPI00313631AF|nr:hypothetical protein [Chloroflexota bacterium]